MKYLYGYLLHFPWPQFLLFEPDTKKGITTLFPNMIDYLVIAKSKTAIWYYLLDLWRPTTWNTLILQNFTLKEILLAEIFERWKGKRITRSFWLNHWHQLIQRSTSSNRPLIINFGFISWIRFEIGTFWPRVT